MTRGGVRTFNRPFAGTAGRDEDDMASDSEVKIATQQSIKAYVDTVTANFLENIVEDTSPELGGDLAMGGFDLDIGGAMWLFVDGELCGGTKSDANGRTTRAKGGPIEISATPNVSENGAEQLAAPEVGDGISPDSPVGAA